jgi:CheY-like chemotaxis protein
MPRKDGREALTEIKGDPDLRRIPVVILTTSSADQDILQSYDLGANSFVVKPVSFPCLVELMTALSGYWTHTVERVPH